MARYEIPDHQIPPEFEDWVGVALACDRCEEVVTEAKYYPVEYMLVWLCSQGHKNFIEDFKG